MAYTLLLVAFAFLLRSGVLGQSTLKIGPDGSTCPADVTVYVSPVEYSTTNGYTTVSSPSSSAETFTTSKSRSGTTTSRTRRSSRITSTSSASSDPGDDGQESSVTAATSYTTTDDSLSTSTSTTLSDAIESPPTSPATSTISSSTTTSPTTTAPLATITYTTSDTAGNTYVTSFVEPALALGDGVPSGTVSDLPAQSTVILGYAFSTAGSGPQRRQAAAAVSAAGYVSGNGSYGGTVLSCAYGTRLTLSNSQLLGVTGDPIAMNATDAYAMMHPWPYASDISTSFTFQDGILNWNSILMGDASFYNCRSAIYAGFPDPPFDYCIPITIGGVASVDCPVDLSGSGFVSPPLNSTNPSSSSMPPYANSTSITTMTSTTATPSDSTSDTGISSSDSADVSASVDVYVTITETYSGSSTLPNPTLSTIAYPSETIPGTIEVFVTATSTAAVAVSADDSDDSDTVPSLTFA